MKGCLFCRFDRQISIDRPDITGREQIFKIHLAKLKLSKPVEYFSERLAALTPSFAGKGLVPAHFCRAHPRVYGCKSVPADLFSDQVD